METTYAFLKQNGLLAAALPILLYLQFDTGAEIRDLREERTARVETRLENIEARLYMDTARPSMALLLPQREHDNVRR